MMESMEALLLSTCARARERRAGRAGRSCTAARDRTAVAADVVPCVAGCSRFGAAFRAARGHDVLCCRSLDDRCPSFETACMQMEQTQAGSTEASCAACTLSSCRRSAGIMMGSVQQDACSWCIRALALQYCGSYALWCRSRAGESAAVAGAGTAQQLRIEIRFDTVSLGAGRNATRRSTGFGGTEVLEMRGRESRTAARHSRPFSAGGGGQGAGGGGRQRGRWARERIGAASVRQFVCSPRPAIRAAQLHAIASQVAIPACAACTGIATASSHGRWAGRCLAAPRVGAATGTLSRNRPCSRTCTGRTVRQ